MIFVDTNVVMYAVGRSHSLREPARRVFREAAREQQPLVTSAEVLQELLHAYLPVGRFAALDAALALVEGAVREIWPVDAADVRLARRLAGEHRNLGARDLIHLAACRRRGVREIRTFDHHLAKAFAG